MPTTATSPEFAMCSNSYCGTKDAVFWERNNYLVRGRFYAVRRGGQWYIAKWIGVRFQIEDDSGHKEDIETKNVEFAVQLP